MTAKQEAALFVKPHSDGGSTRAKINGVWVTGPYAEIKAKYDAAVRAHAREKYRAKKNAKADTGNED